MSYSSENNSSPEISVDCIQLIVGTFSKVSSDSFFKIEQDIYIHHGNPPRDPTGRLKEFEGYWMIKLNTLEPFGLNGINEYERIIKKQLLKIMFDEEISSEF